MMNVIAQQSDWDKLWVLELYVSVMSMFWGLYGMCQICDSCSGKGSCTNCVELFTSVFWIVCMHTLKLRSTGYACWWFSNFRAAVVLCWLPIHQEKIESSDRMNSWICGYSASHQFVVWSEEWSHGSSSFSSSQLHFNACTLGLLKVGCSQTLHHTWKRYNTFSRNAGVKWQEVSVSKYQL